MIDNSSQHTQGIRRGKLAVPLQDLLLTQSDHGLSDYLSLSLSECGEHTKVSITTTDVEPLTYSAFIHVSAPLDFASVVFVAQPVKLGELSDHRTLPDKRKACVRIARLAPFWRVLRQKGSQRRR
ncbi:hypothetical protein [Methylomonas rosea]|uniref:Uncharacterized protein n=1 Tax=Methylomonas rosea TaxID=2952227 RepID=A0ABT1TX93_9GAMM|nr:hypothetical protein [Methylomonas sp. WSC-7]MCQ8119396.1 hypothetical protein [Methylomonas sp. WSC-7]